AVIPAEQLSLDLGEVLIVLVVDVKAAADREELAFEVADELALRVEHFDAGAEQVPTAAEREDERIVGFLADLQPCWQKLLTHEPAKDVGQEADRFVGGADEFAGLGRENVVALD